MANESRVVIRGYDLASEAFKSVERSAKSLGTQIFEVTTTISSMVSIASHAARAVTAMATAMAEPVKQALEAERAQTLLAAKVRATGAAAGYSVGELNSLASSMAKVTTFGDDAIVSAEGLLLQYQNITRSGGVFEKALALSADLAIAMGTDLNDAVVKVGKALNDPADKLESLSKIGVTFTETEEKMIQAMAEANNVAGAQQQILSKLESSVGGTAESMRNSFGGALATVKNAWDDLLENIGKFITESPVVQAAMKRAAELINDWSAALIEGSGPMGEFRTWFDEMISIAIPGMVRGLSVLVGGFFDLTSTVIYFGAVIKDALTAPLTYIAEMAAGFVTMERRLRLISESEYQTRLMEISEALGYTGESARTAAERTAEGLNEMKDAIQAALGVAADQLENLRVTANTMGEVTAEATKAAKNLDLFGLAMRGVERAKTFMKMADEARRAGEAISDAGDEFEKAFKPSGPGPVELLEHAGAGMVEFGEFAATATENVEDTVAAVEGVQEAVLDLGGVQEWFLNLVGETDEAWKEAEREWERSVETMSDNTADAFTDAFAQAAAGMTPLEEGLYSFTQTLRQQMAHAFLDPILGAQGPIARLFDPVFNVLKSIGTAIAENFIKPLISGITSYFVQKQAAEAVSEQTSAGLQIATIAEVAIAQKALAATMGPAIGAMASAMLVATFGAAASAASALPGILALGAAQGTAAVAFAEGGRVTQPTFALIGEAGNETVIPESRPRRARELLEDMFSRNPSLSPNGRGVHSARSLTVQNYVTIQGVPDDPEALAEQIYDAINKKLGRDLRGR